VGRSGIKESCKTKYNSFHKNILCFSTVDNSVW